jgi:hypothetical protein
MQKNIDRGYHIVIEGKTDADWKAIAERDMNFKKMVF